MTSVELVAYINEERAPGAAELQHKNFLPKVPEVLGETSAKFFGTDTYVNGTGARVQRGIYLFPKCDACLMAMSYSYELQAKVINLMH